jgi:hypothetical protein
MSVVMVEYFLKLIKMVKDKERPTFMELNFEGTQYVVWMGEYENDIFTRLVELSKERNEWEEKAKALELETAKLRAIIPPANIENLWERLEEFVLKSEMENKLYIRDGVIEELKQKIQKQEGLLLVQKTEFSHTIERILFSLDNQSKLLEENIKALNSNLQYNESKFIRERLDQTESIKKMIEAILRQHEN